jgi:hypothetical protein
MTDTTKPPRRAKTRWERRAADGPRREAASESPTSRSVAAPDPIDVANLDQAFVAALKADFIIHGKGAIEAMRAEKPVEYVKIVAALRTKDAGDNMNPLREMSDEELDRRIAELAAQAGYEIRPAAVPRREDADSEEAD